MYEYSLNPLIIAVGNFSEKGVIYFIIYPYTVIGMLYQRSRGQNAVQSNRRACLMVEVFHVLL